MPAGERGNPLTYEFQGMSRKLMVDLGGFLAPRLRAPTIDYANP
jgi:hypothetical protein